MLPASFPIARLAMLPVILSLLFLANQVKTGFAILTPLLAAIFLLAMAGNEWRLTPFAESSTPLLFVEKKDSPMIRM